MPTQMNNNNVIVIGGGAAGMVCAIAAARRGKSVTILEKNPAPGKKIYATGNGRCNITNKQCLNTKEVQTFFRSIGLEIFYDDEGRAYPVSRQAADVVFLLERELAALGVEFKGGRPVDWIAKIEDDKGRLYEISSGRESFTAGEVVIATGGKAGSKFGTTGDGYALAQSLGHTVCKPIPVLTAIECFGDFTKLKGIRSEAKCTLLKKGETVFTEEGEVQFTDYGLSGICIFNMSRYLLLAEGVSFNDYEISLDLSGDSTDDEIEKLIAGRRNIRGLKKVDALRGLVPEELAKYIVEKSLSGCGDLNDSLSGLTEDEIESICRNYRQLSFTVKGAKGWQMAQCTKGGVSLDEINMDTMESALCEGLFFAGEVIDYDGPCGGFNLQNAWETGLKAGANV